MGNKQVLLMVGTLLTVSLAQGQMNEAGHRHPDSSSAAGHHQGHHTHDHGAHSNGHQAQHRQTLAGTPGRPEQVDRIVVVEASDQMRFLHEPIRVRPGETIEFRVTNSGRIPHEFVIGVKREHAEHRELMRAHPTMTHDEANAVMLAPGETRTLIWTFAKTEQIELACNIPGHYEAGMFSLVEVE